MVYNYTIYSDPPAGQQNPIISTDIKIAKKEFGVWQPPQSLTFDLPEKTDLIHLIGMSPDGKQLFVKIDSKKEAGFYMCTLEGTKCKNFIWLDFLDAKYVNNRISMSASGKIIYFASNQPGGFGGMDIYKIMKGRNGKWSNIENLGPTVNTKYDEISPCLHPDNKTLYFSSNGHRTMGGFDLFQTKIRNDGTWEECVNLGFPVNTTIDNTDISLTDKGNTAYFSSSQYDKYNNNDIYSVKLIDNIPVTFINGILKGDDKLNLMHARIRILEESKSSNMLVNTDPDIESGKYFIFCPPGKNYNMLVEAEGYLPQLIKMQVPKQSNFYELFQQINLQKINALDTTLGEEIMVRNYFYDVDTSKNKTKPLSKLDINSKEYENLIQLIDQINVEKTDTTVVGINIDPSQKEKKKEYGKLFNFIEDAIENTDSLSLLLLARETKNSEKYTQSYFYSTESAQQHLYPVIVYNDTIYTARPINTITEKPKTPLSEDIKELIKSNRIISLLSDSVLKIYKPKDTINQKQVGVDTLKRIENKRFKNKVIYSFQLFFESNSAKIDSNYIKRLREISDLLINNPTLTLEISGFSNSIGREDPNLELSRKRASVVVDFFIEHKVEKNRIKMIYYGESQAKDERTEEKRRKNRRVELKIFDIVVMNQ
jgi:outer membrane protein OmpA-like peptidoglycan-associated protein